MLNPFSETHSASEESWSASDETIRFEFQKKAT